MKLNYKRTFLIGMAFLSISAFWQMYDNIIPLILQNTFHLNEAVIGAIMAIDNVLAVFLLPLIGICLLVFTVTVVYLCTAAGRKPRTDAVHAGGLNRLPLDLYLGLGIFAGTAITSDVTADRAAPGKFNFCPTDNVYGALSLLTDANSSTVVLYLRANEYIVSPRATTISFGLDAPTFDAPPYIGTRR